MAIFSTRSSSQRGADAARKSNVPVDSVETLRTRARQRLIGAAVLVVIGVVGFTLLFDTQPRPIPVDIEISIPDKDKTERLGMPAATTAPAVTTAPSAAPAPAAVPNVQLSASLSPKEELLAAKPLATEVAKAEPKAEPKPEKKVEKQVEKPIEKKPEVAVAVKAEPKPVVKPAVADDGAKAKAILEGKEPVKESAKAANGAAADGAGRFVVQIGAFADGTKAHEVRVKLEKAGLKTYTNVAQTKEGARTRVRVGPFAKRDEAEKAAAKIKKLDLPAAILTL